MGYNNDLIYWQPLLRDFVKFFPNTIFLTCETQAKIEQTNCEVEKSVKKLTIVIGKLRFSIPSPFILIKLFKYKPDLLVISEFGLLSIYAAFYKIFNKKSQLLLLVENDPSFLENFFKKKRKNIFFTTIRRFIAKCADKILCNNKKTAEYLESDLKVKKEKITVACYLSSSQEINSTLVDKPKGKIVLLFVGRLIKSKGVHLLIEAVRLLSEASKNRLFIKIVGDGSEFVNLEKLTETYGLSRVITYYGRQPYSKLGSFFSSSDIFVFPTLGDYRALVGFEAISAGLPIIGSVFDGASDEIIKEGLNGFIIDPLDITTLANKIQFFIENENKIVEFGRASIEIYQRVKPEIAAANIINAAKTCFT